MDNELKPLTVKIRQPRNAKLGGAGAMVTIDKSCTLSTHQDQTLFQPNEGKYIVRQLTPTECARLQGFPDWWCSDLEDENPDQATYEFWKDIFDQWCQFQDIKPKTEKQIKTWLAKHHSDAAEYKLWGNGIALPNAEFVLGGIARYEEKKSKGKDD